MTDEEKQRLLDNTLIGTSRRLREAHLTLLKAMACEWRTLVAIATLVLTFVLILAEHLRFP